LNIFALTPSEFALADERALAASEGKGVYGPYEKALRRKDDTTVSVMVGGAQLEDMSQETVAFVLDLTERKAVEQQLLRIQRTETIGALAGGVAHDLNNILAPITLCLELLAERLPATDDRDVLRVLGDSAHRGAELVRQILDFSRGGEGTRQLVPLKPLFEELAPFLRQSLPRSLDIQLHAADNVWPIMANPTHLHQVLVNLSINARDAMPDGGTLTIEASNANTSLWPAPRLPLPVGRTYVRIAVRDTGLGIPPHLLGRIFEPFFTTKEVGRGTGLGLSTARAIVERHDGYMDVISTVGQGTSVVIYLPAEESLGEDRRPIAATAGACPSSQPLTVLLVDDEAAIRAIQERVLIRAGYQVLTAANGREGADVFARHRDAIDLVITDLSMPEADGRALTRAIRHMGSQVGIILTSGYAPEEELEESRRAGVTRFLNKPATGSQLLDVVNEILAAQIGGTPVQH
jgi:two-component system, cell cycle sensor histidine kinase and response regulator CckA